MYSSSRRYVDRAPTESVATAFIWLFLTFPSEREGRFAIFMLHKRL